MRFRYSGFVFAVGISLIHVDSVIHVCFGGRCANLCSFTFMFDIYFFSPLDYLIYIISLLVINFRFSIEFVG